MCLGFDSSPGRDDWPSHYCKLQQCFFPQESVDLLVIVNALHNYAIFRVIAGEQYVPKSPRQQVVFKFSDGGWRGGLIMVELGDQTKKLPFNSASTNVYNFKQPSLHLLASSKHNELPSRDQKDKHVQLQLVYFCWRVLFLPCSLFRLWRMLLPNP